MSGQDTPIREITGKIIKTFKTMYNSRSGWKSDFLIKKQFTLKV